MSHERCRQPHAKHRARSQKGRKRDEELRREKCETKQGNSRLEHECWKISVHVLLFSDFFFAFLVLSAKGAERHDKYIRAV